MSGYTVRVSRLVWGSESPECITELVLADLPVLIEQDAKERRLDADRLRVYLVEVSESGIMVERQVFHGNFAEVWGMAWLLCAAYAAT